MLDYLRARSLLILIMEEMVKLFMELNQVDLLIKRFQFVDLV